MSQITVRYFAAAAEAAGHEEESWQVDETATLDTLHEALVARYGDPMARVLKAGSFLLNGTVRRGSDFARTATPNGSVVDVLPPFAGG